MQTMIAWLRTTSGRSVGLVVVLLLAALTWWTASFASPSGPGPGIVGLELVGNGEGAQRWIDAYSGEALMDSLQGDLAFIICWSPLLALLSLWTGQNYRTLTTRRLAGPIALAALAAGVLDLVEDAFLQLALGGLFGGDPASLGWQLATVASWGKWIVVLIAGTYVVGGMLSLGLRGSVRDVLRGAGETGPEQRRYTQDVAGLGLAFSGGGIRAASISLGALQTLERDGSQGWDRADHVTSVSGGSYMAGAWSLARSLHEPVSADQSPWAGPPPGPEEQHLRANLGYLLSNTPRGTGEDSMSSTQEAADTARAQRLPAVVATVLSGMLANALVFLGVLWVLSQLLGWFYRWYFGLSCPGWRDGAALDYDADHGCLQASGRAGTVLAWYGIGLVFVLVWVLLAKFTDVSGQTLPAPSLLVSKYLGYGGLALGTILLVFLTLVPILIDLLWRPVSGHDQLASLVAGAGALGSATAVFRILRKPFARLAPVLGGLVFGLLLLFLVCRWALGAAGADPSHRHGTAVVVATVALLVVHFMGATEFWSLAGFYRGKLRSAFATYRVTGANGRVRARAYVNNDTAGPGERVEPSLDELVPGGGTAVTRTPLTICASATVTGRDVLTHYGVPAMSVTFSPTAVRLFAPLEDDGLWQCYECTAAEMGVLRPALSPRLTTMMAVGLSGAAVSPAMGRYRVGPISMLLAFANVRLGAWIPNPRYASVLAAQNKRLPRPGLGYLFKEFFGFHDPSDLYLYVTDGGHWENTALVELLRTAHHREIVCVDADSGPGNLASSISKAIDLAKLECDAAVAIDLDCLRADRDPSPGHDYSPRSVSFGLVHRTDDGRDRISVLWYCKPALTEDMPPRLLAYREVDPTFPRVSTVNQFFHVAQFAAYRDLGRYNARKILAARGTLADAVREHPSFTEFRQAVETTGADALLADLVNLAPVPGAGQEPVAPEPWVLAEMVRLVQQLALEQAPGERAAYGEKLYAAVRTALA